MTGVGIRVLGNLQHDRRTRGWGSGRANSRVSGCEDVRRPYERTGGESEKPAATGRNRNGDHSEKTEIPHHYQVHVKYRGAGGNERGVEVDVARDRDLSRGKQPEKHRYKGGGNELRQDRVGGARAERNKVHSRAGRGGAGLAVGNYRERGPLSTQKRSRGKKEDPTERSTQLTKAKWGLGLTEKGSH